MSLDDVYLPPIKPGTTLRIELYNNGTGLEARVDYPAWNLRLYANLLFILLICLFLAGIYFTWQWFNRKSDDEDGERPAVPNPGSDKAITQADNDTNGEQATTEGSEEEMKAIKGEYEAEHMEPTSNGSSKDEINNPMNVKDETAEEKRVQFVLDKNEIFEDEPDEKKSVKLESEEKLEVKDQPDLKIKQEPVSEEEIKVKDDIHEQIKEASDETLPKTEVKDEPNRIINLKNDLEEKIKDLHEKMVKHEQDKEIKQEPTSEEALADKNESNGETSGEEVKVKKEQADNVKEEQADNVKQGQHDKVNIKQELDEKTE